MVPLRGFPEPISYHELRWGRELFGTRSQVVTDAVGQMQSGPQDAAAQPNATATPTSGFDRVLGTLKMWIAERNFGFIAGAADEDFFVAPNLFVYPDDVPVLKPGAQLAFVPVAASGAGKSRRAGAVLVVGEEAEGVVVSIPRGPQLRMDPRRGLVREPADGVDFDSSAAVVDQGRTGVLHRPRPRRQGERGGSGAGRLNQQVRARPSSGMAAHLCVSTWLSATALSLFRAVHLQPGRPDWP